MLGVFIVFGLTSSSANTCSSCSASRRCAPGCGRALGRRLHRRLVAGAADRCGGSARLAIVAGLLVAAAGLGFLTQVGAASALGRLVTGRSCSLGLAPVFTLATDLRRVGAAGARRRRRGPLRDRSELGGALGIAILGQHRHRCLPRPGDRHSSRPASRPLPPAPATRSAVPSPPPVNCRTSGRPPCSLPPATPSATACT